MNKKIPKYIEDALRRRTRAALSFYTNDFIISEYIDSHPELLEMIDSDDFYGGVEIIVNPIDSERMVREAIKTF